MRTSIHQLKSDRGQSATELALMMPIILLMFFWAFQVNILMQGYHQVAYASFMAARGFEVRRNGHGEPDKIRRMILTGRVFTSSASGTPGASVTTRSGAGGWGKSDGVKISMPAFASLWGASDMLQFSSAVPTHLGINEYDQNEQNFDDGTACKLTDNDIPDNHC